MTAQAGLLIHLVGIERAYASRLWRAFSKDGWHVQVFPDIESFGTAGGPQSAGLALLGCCHPEDAAEPLGRLGEVPAIVIDTGSCADPCACGLKWIEAGADFFRENQGDRLLAAKVRAYARRLFPAVPADRGAAIRFPSLVIDAANRVVLAREGRGWREAALLTGTEAALLACLACRRGEVLSVRDLLEAAWGSRSEAVNPEIVCKYVSRLKRKLRASGIRLRTVYGKGYSFGMESAPGSYE